MSVSINNFSSNVQQNIQKNPSIFNDIISTAKQIGAQLGLTPSQNNRLQEISVATANTESGLNPNAVQSGLTATTGGVGLFQLSPGGEGSNLTITQKLNPITNSQTAIQQIASVLKGNPSLSNGQIAFIAQRPSPSVESSYISQVNGDILTTSKQQSGGASPVYIYTYNGKYYAGASPNSSGASPVYITGSGNNLTASATPGSQSGGVVSGAGASILTKIGTFVLGAGLLFIGVNMLAKNSNTVNNVKETPTGLATVE